MSGGCLCWMGGCCCSPAGWVGAGVLSPNLTCPSSCCSNSCSNIPPTCDAMLQLCTAEVIGLPQVGGEHMLPCCRSTHTHRQTEYTTHRHRHKYNTNTHTDTHRVHRGTETPFKPKVKCSSQLILLFVQWQRILFVCFVA